MEKHEQAKIIGVDQIDNAALVEFEGEPEPAVFPALLLHAAKGLGKIMFEKDNEKEEK